MFILPVLGLIATDVAGFALDGDEFGRDLLFGRSKFLGDGREDLFEVGVFRLRGKGAKSRGWACTGLAA